MNHGLKQTADQRRLDVLEMVYSARTGHIGGSMSCIDLLTCLYYRILDVEKIKRKEEDRDRFILSKGHCAEALYAILGDKELFPKEKLKTYAKFRTQLAEHPTHNIPGIETATGALGHGLCIGVGMAIAAKRTKSRSKVYVLMGDGEQAEGSNWEAAMAASKFRLDNLVAIVDRNRLQISGVTEEVMPLENLAEKYAAFGWEVRHCNGHDFSEMLSTFQQLSCGKPVVIIADTVKGKGISYMENHAEWHHMVPNEEQYHIGKQEILARLECEQNGE